MTVPTRPRPANHSPPTRPKRDRQERRFYWVASVQRIMRTPLRTVFSRAQLGVVGMCEWVEGERALLFGRAVRVGCIQAP